MKVILHAVLAVGLAATAKAAQPADVALWRIDCGRFDNFDMKGLSDDDRHGTDYVLWDAGLPTGSLMKLPGEEQRLVRSEASQPSSRRSE